MAGRNFHSLSYETTQHLKQLLSSALESIRHGGVLTRGIRGGFSGGRVRESRGVVQLQVMKLSQAQVLYIHLIQFSRHKPSL